jgi:MoxR-like ATPase
MTPAQTEAFLESLIARNLKLAVMLWGPPGIGKSSLVHQVAHNHGLEMVDVRLSQLAPTDLRGLPVPEDGIAKWYPPEFLPRAGKGILFVDEINLAAPAMQGIAQQLILDRKVGSYIVPDGWFIWAAGNRREDGAAVAEMISPLANRFVHLDVRPHLESFTAYGVRNGWHPDILGFVNFKPDLLHALDRKHPAWPSPRSWGMAAGLLEANLDVSHAVGDTAGKAFQAYRKICASLPDCDAILEGRSDASYPSARELQFAVTTRLAIGAKTAVQLAHAVTWVEQDEMRQYLFASRFSSLEPDDRRVFLGQLRPLLNQFPALKTAHEQARDLIAELCP